MAWRGRVQGIVLAVGLAATLAGCTGTAARSGGAGAPSPSSMTGTALSPPVTSSGTASPTPTATKASTIVLSSKGIGPFQFGAPQKAVLAFLTPALGKPKMRGGVGACEEAAMGYQAYAGYGTLSVRFAAKTNSSKSPRTLKSWEITFTGAPKAPLALAKGIPVGKSLAQLKALYPKGSGLEHMGAWAAAGVVLVPPAKSGGQTIVHAGGLDWCT